MPQSLAPNRDGFVRVVPWFYRIVALIWLVKGFLGWASLFGLSFLGIIFKPYGPQADLVISILFSILDLIAAVSLWLSYRWGSVVWTMVAALFIAVDIYLYLDIRSFFAIIITSILIVIHFLILFYLKLAR